MRNDHLKRPAEDLLNSLQSSASDKIDRNNVDDWETYLYQTIHLRTINENEITRMGLRDAFMS